MIYSAVIRARAKALRGFDRLYHIAHRVEFPLHVTYFGALGTGMLPYHTVAALCFAVGLVVLAGAALFGALGGGLGE